MNIRLLFGVAFAVLVCTGSAFAKTKRSTIIRKRPIPDKAGLKLDVDKPEKDELILKLYVEDTVELLPEVGWALKKDNTKFYDVEVHLGETVFKGKAGSKGKVRLKDLFFKITTNGRVAYIKIHSTKLSAIMGIKVEKSRKKREKRSGAISLPIKVKVSKDGKTTTLYDKKLTINYKSKTNGKTDGKL